ncbi:UNC-like C-terminal-domain-containing protein [Clohesyomyces aquaticus]|uniref:UNC-like C-terminal-domain-containing protein n=1 Tax=Clohesyomyces aquaticus TaxID=1231657 RepID=A0A1Y1ZHE9_9PLEO|nr:UNC-like C-terminal-domain-containing protein [Clohesyomyces aquaticus]
MSQFAPTPLRRSARISVTRSVGEGASVAETTATQNRSAVRRKGPLPKVQAQQSHAYGAAGRMATAQELLVPDTGFAQAFAAQRDNAVARDEERSSVHGSSPVSSRSSSPIVVRQAARDFSRGYSASQSARAPPARVASQSPSVASNEDFEEDERRSHNVTPSVNSEARGSPTPSHVDTSKSFGMVHEAGMTAAEAARAAQIAQIAQANRATQAARLNGNIRSVTQSQSQQPIRPHVQSANVQDADEDDTPPEHFTLKKLLYVIGGLIFAFLVVGPIASSIKNSDTSSVGLLGALNARIAYTWDGLANYIIPQVVDPTNPHVTYGYDLSRRVTNIETSLTDIDGTLNRFGKYLPDAIVLRRKANGDLEIPDEFWRALESKLKSEGLGKPTVTGDVNWIDFLNKNQAKITQIIQSELENHTTPSSLEIIQRKEFLDLLHQEYVKISDRVDRKIAEASKTLSKEAKTVAQQVASKAFIDQVRIDSLAYTNLVANAELSLRKVNFFSPGLGARVDPYKTSSTFADPSTLRSKAIQRLFSLQSRRPPVSALEKWDEPGECWCAAPSDGKTGLAQLAVNLGQKMVPRQVTVEHLPKEASLDFSTAPKEMELWVETNELVEDLGCSVAPSGWACLGKFAYNIHGSNHIQTFNLDVDLAAPVAKTMVRVGSTWGAPHPCLYRLRLHGDNA